MGFSTGSSPLPFFFQCGTILLEYIGTRIGIGNVTKPLKLQLSHQILHLPFSDDLLLSFFFSSDGELIFSDTSSLIPFAFLLMGLMEGALGRDGSVLFVCGGPGDWSSITCAHTFSILKYKQKFN